jgi:D-3-phosphoglycerate dehydrogenase
MKILGSVYGPVMERLARKLQGIAEVSDYQPHLPREPQLADAEVIILGALNLSAADFVAAPRLKLVHQHGRSVDGVDLAAATAAGVQVANVPVAQGSAVAEHAFAQLLYLAKRFHRVPLALEQRLLGIPDSLELVGKTLAIIGLGDAGRELALRAKAFGMRVLGIRAKPQLGSEVELDFLGGPTELRNVLAEADFVVLLATLDTLSANMIGEAELRVMKPSAYLLNPAHAGLVDRAALLYALVTGRIAGAAFDVLWNEPAAPDDPLLLLNNFHLTPHSAGYSDRTIETVTDEIARNIVRLKQGQPLKHVINWLELEMHAARRQWPVVERA